MDQVYMSYSAIGTDQRYLLPHVNTIPCMYLLRVIYVGHIMMASGQNETIVLS